MKKLGLIASVLVLGAVGCTPDTKNSERKLDEMQKDIRDIKASLAALQKGGMGAGAAQRPQRAEPDRSKTYAVPVDGSPAWGNADAKVTLVKAYDYACPYCEKVRPTMNDLKAKYGNDLRIVYKQLVVHPRNAMASALAFCAANEQGGIERAKKFDEYLWDKGFKARQLDNSDVAPAAEKGGGGGGGGKCWDQAGGCAIVVGFAQEAGLNVDKFKADMKGKCLQLVQKDMGELQRLAVGATPSFFVNGRFISGAMPMENFSTLIDEELKKANERIQQGTPAADYYNQWVIQKGLKTVERPQ
ncbi:MAG: DsbA family protein [Kofleriaceae bacterium]